MIFHADNADNHKGHYKFEFAPKASTYIELTGWFENADKTVAADVRYYIHLGNFGKDLNHFSVERDHHYTYNVTINGVDDIVVEVEDENEKNSGSGKEWCSSMRLSHISMPILTRWR